jgi:hypothetical protein
MPQEPVAGYATLRKGDDLHTLMRRTVDKATDFRQIGLLIPRRVLELNSGYPHIFHHRRYTSSAHRRLQKKTTRFVSSASRTARAVFTANRPCSGVPCSGGRLSRTHVTK